MFKKFSFLLLSLAVLLTACGNAKNPVAGFRKLTSKDFDCYVNIYSENGEILFGGVLEKNTGYTFTAELPSGISGTVFKFENGSLTESIGDFTLTLDSNAAKKISDVANAFEALASEDKPCISEEKLYSSECYAAKTDFGDVYISPIGVPMMIKNEIITAEITGFNGKDR